MEITVTETSMLQKFYSR